QQRGCVACAYEPPTPLGPNATLSSRAGGVSVEPRQTVMPARSASAVGSAVCLIPFALVFQFFPHGQARHPVELLLDVLTVAGTRPVDRDVHPLVPLEVRPLPPTHPLLAQAHAGGGGSPRRSRAARPRQGQPARAGRSTYP